MTTPICFSLPSDLIERIDAAAAADDRSRSSFVRRVLQHALADDAALRREADARFASLQNSGAVPLPATPDASVSSAADAFPPAAAAVSPSRSRAAGGHFPQETHMSEQERLADERQRKGAEIASATTGAKAAADRRNDRPVPHQDVGERSNPRPEMPAETWRGSR